MKTFGDIDPYYNEYENAEILLQSIPYDGTSTWGKGADKGFDAFMEAAANMELYDIETDSEVYKKGIHLLPEIDVDVTPEALFKEVHGRTKQLLQTDKFLTFFGGEHSISIGIIKAMYQKYPDITVLQLDAHADLRPEYLDSKYNHACAVFDAAHNTNLIQVGVRSMDVLEKEYLNPNQCYFAHRLHGSDGWMKKAVGQMTDKVYITIDLDVFDPSVMPATGTPEPGGMDWYQITKFLKMVFESREVIGFDLVELAPMKDNPAPNFLAAKLYYKLLSYKFHLERNF
ncbi:MAG: agmatinase [Candidatus Marinimicrobia bacterium]|nr:agmatinase [Candidatus Neomarinimicrobiota bacterium]